MQYCGSNGVSELEYEGPASGEQAVVFGARGWWRPGSDGLELIIPWRLRSVQEGRKP
jgi:hypothetical protein